MDSLIKKKRFQSLIIIFIFAFLWASNAQAGKVQIVEGTEVKVKFDASMKISSGSLQKGIPLLIYLAESIVIGGKIIVEEGAMGTAEVLEVKEASKAGKPGYIKVSFVELTPKGDYVALDGSNIKLKGEIDAEGKGKKLLSWVFIFGLFIKGGQGVLPSDAIYTVYTAETIRLSND
jgi:hypothetical protein